MTYLEVKPKVLSSWIKLAVTDVSLHVDALGLPSEFAILCFSVFNSIVNFTADVYKIVCS